MNRSQITIEALEAAAQSSPEYAEVVPLFIELFRYTDSRVNETGITVCVPPVLARQRVADGSVAVAPRDLSVDEKTCRSFLAGVVEVLGRCRKDGGAELEALNKTVVRGTVDLSGLFRSILNRDRAVIEESARENQVEAALLEYLCEIALKTALERFAGTIALDELAGCGQNCCPVCGSRPAMAELIGDEGRRYLSCSTCATRWLFKRLQCPFCGNEEADKLSYFTAGACATRVDVCNACSRYIKTRDTRLASAEVPLGIEDLLSIHLDMVAAREGFERGK